MRLSAQGSPGLAVKIGAVGWFLEKIDAVRDAKGLRQLRALVRSRSHQTGAFLPQLASSFCRPPAGRGPVCL